MPRRFHDVDALVGGRVRLRRKELGITQAGLSEKIGLSFQQLQKYESASNRISAGILYEISKALSVPIGYFFEDCETGSMAKAANGRREREAT